MLESVQQLWFPIMKKKKIEKTWHQHILTHKHDGDYDIKKITYSGAQNYCLINSKFIYIQCHCLPTPNFISKQANCSSCVILYQSQLNCYGLELCIVQKCIFTIILNRQMFHYLKQICLTYLDGTLIGPTMPDQSRSRCNDNEFWGVHLSMGSTVNDVRLFGKYLEKFRKRFCSWIKEFKWCFNQSKYDPWTSLCFCHQLTRLFMAVW